MTALDLIRSYQPGLVELRRHLHAHPEFGFAEHATAARVADELRALGIEVHEGIGATGVVGVLQCGNGSGTIGLRADMDALPITEENTFAHASRHPGCMHACGHDGHTATLLGAARYLAETRRFNGRVVFIFQPAEEGLGGALAMLEDGLFARFPCDAIFAMHNTPGMKVGRFAISPGAMMAGGAFFDVTVSGRGAHGARPDHGVDPVLAACHVVSALQSIVSRNVDPRDPAVLSVTRVDGGNAYNVIPERAVIRGTARAFHAETMDLIERNLRRIAEHVAAGFGATAAIDFCRLFAPLVNDPSETAAIADAASALVGPENVNREGWRTVASEDFSFMLERCPGAYIRIGNGDGAPVHHPRYEFNDDILPLGAALFATLVERKLPHAA
ncbi:MAG: amidohydrolase [Acetobacteraceae bacterium]|nr:amidohydrolase [Acetobacteraceae bacterium]